MTAKPKTIYPTKAKKSKKEEPSSNGQSDLIKELWQAADTLRGSIEPADYKRYVLPIIFLRFLSLRYQRRRDELANLVKEPDSEYYTSNPRSAEATLNDPDEYRSAGAFILPENAQWDYIRTNAQSDIIKVILDDALELLENTYPEKLRGLLPRIYGGSNLERESVSGLINLFSKDIFKQDLKGKVPRHHHLSNEARDGANTLSAYIPAKSSNSSHSLET